MKETQKIFDRIFKRLMQTASSKAIIALVNGLFGTKYPENSKIKFPSTVSVNENLGESISDMLMLINGTDLVHIDVQTDPDFNMAVRMFLYDFEAALKTAQRSKTGDVVMDLPRSIVLYWETTKTTPNEHKVTIRAPDGAGMTYRVPTYKVLDHTLEDIEHQKLLLLLPFYMLKLRKQVGNALKRKTNQHELLNGYAKEMEKTVRQIQEILNKSAKTRLLTKDDKMGIIGFIDVILGYCYGKIKEFEEVSEMVEILTRNERAIRDAKRSIAKILNDEGVSPDIITKSTGVPMKEIERLNKPRQSARKAA
jgi:hypothetical protein